MKKSRKEDGAVIVEATIVFPVMLLVILFLLYTGNVYYQICRVDAIVNKLAIEGAAYYADPLVTSIEKGSIPDVGEHHVYPYRTFDTNGVGDIQSDLEAKAQKAIRELGTGLFANMEPSASTVTVVPDNKFIYSTVTVNAQYKIQIPVKLLGMEDYMSVKVYSQANMPVSDVPEFIRNVDMIEDYMQKTGVSEKISDATEKAKAGLQKALDTAKTWFKKEDS